MFSGLVVIGFVVFIHSIGSLQNLEKLPEKNDYLWILLYGFLSNVLGVSPYQNLNQYFLSLGVLSVGSLVLNYGLLSADWQIPISSALLSFVLNSVILDDFYRISKARIQDRQLVIDQIFDAIHNGPLQTLARLLRTTKESTSVKDVRSDLEHLNRELRAVYEVVQQETLPQNETLYFCNGIPLNLQYATHELLHEVYRATLMREFPNFKTIKVKIVSFENIDLRLLSLEQKRGLCRFLEEALCNAGKYAIGMTRLEVVCKLENGWVVIRVVDNGSGMQLPTSHAGGRGTLQAKNLARQLGGTFRRLPKLPHGTICELTYPVVKFWF